MDAKQFWANALVSAVVSLVVVLITLSVASPQLSPFRPASPKAPTPSPTINANACSADDECETNSVSTGVVYFPTNEGGRLKVSSSGGFITSSNLAVVGEANFNDKTTFNDLVDVDRRIRLLRPDGWYWGIGKTVAHGQETNDFGILNKRTGTYPLWIKEGTNSVMVDGSLTIKSLITNPPNSTRMSYVCARPDGTLVPSTTPCA